MDLAVFPRVQLAHLPTPLDHIVTATGSNLPILGIGVSAPQNTQEEKVYELAVATAERVGSSGCVVRSGRFSKGQNIVFLHTGGSAGLFAYADTFKV